MKTMTYPQPLKSEEEREVIKRAYRGDERAKSRLIEHNLRLVIYIAHTYRNTGMDVEDLASIGNIGLIKAVHSFDPTKKNKFSTYASKCIQNEILMHLRKTKKNKQEVYFEDTMNIDNEGNQLSILDVIGTDKEEVEEEVQFNETFELVRDILEQFSEEERRIIYYRFGIDCTKRKQSEIAQMFNISQSYVSRIEKKVLTRIKKAYEKKEKTIV